MGKTMQRLKLELRLLLRQYGKQLVWLVPLLLIGGLITAVWLLWPLPMPTSAVACKSNIHRMTFPNPEERKRQLQHWGEDVFAVENEYFQIVESPTHMCQHQVHLGPEGDGGWEICVDPSFRFKDNCLVYSFGIGHDFRFELALEDMFQCEVYTFDPSMGVKPHQYSEKGHFYDWGLDDVNSMAANGRWRMRRLKSIMQDLEHEGRTIDYLKMDIEFSEWPALHDIIQSGLINQVRQIAFETHTPEMDIHERPDHPCTWSKLGTMQFMLKVLVDLRNAGFSMYYTRTNYRTKYVSGLTKVERYCCHNLHYINHKHKDNAWRPR